MDDRKEWKNGENTVPPMTEAAGEPSAEQKMETEQAIAELQEVIRKTGKPYDMDMIDRGIETARRAHAGQ